MSEPGKKRSVPFIDWVGTQPGVTRWKKSYGLATWPCPVAAQWSASPRAKGPSMIQDLDKSASWFCSQDTYSRSVSRDSSPADDKFRLWIFCVSQSAGLKQGLWAPAGFIWQNGEQSKREKKKDPHRTQARSHLEASSSGCCVPGEPEKLL